MASKTQLLKLQDGESITQEPYRSLIGSLMYMMTCTRPDLAVPVSQLAQFMAQPSPTHWQAAKRVVRHLKGTADLGLTFPSTQHPDFSNLISAYCDSDWARDPNDRKSFTGYVIFLEGSLISWKCKKQASVALSTAEAEYMALAMTATEVIWLRQLLSDIGFPQTTPSTIFCDNQSTIHLASTEVVSPKSKHIAIRYHFIKEQVSSGTIALKYIPTGDNLADFMTKPLEGSRFLNFRDGLNLTKTTGI